MWSHDSQLCLANQPTKPWKCKSKASTNQNLFSVLQFAHVKGLFILKLFSFRKSRHKMDWPPPTEDKTTLENTPCLGSGRQGLIQRLKNGRGMGGGGRALQLHCKQPLSVKVHKQKQPFCSLFTMFNTWSAASNSILKKSHWMRAIRDLKIQQQWPQWEHQTKKQYV